MNLFYPNYTKNNTFNVFKGENLDQPIKYTPYEGRVPMGAVMERDFECKSTNKTNAFFYPRDPTLFFKNTPSPTLDYPIHKDTSNQRINYYNSTFNQSTNKKYSELLSNSKSPHTFFKDNQLTPKYHNKAQSPLSKIYPHVSAFNEDVTQFSCNKITCKNSFNDTDML